MEKMIKLRLCGVEQNRGYISESLARSAPGHLLIKDTDFQGRHRLMKVARFFVPGDEPGSESRREVMLEAELGTWENGMVRIRGIERSKDANGAIVEYRQEWLVQTGHRAECKGKATAKPNLKSIFSVLNQRLALQ
jgi:hypothetical protein